MAQITFKAKPETMHTVEGEPLYQFITVPQLDRKHCNMSAFRCHAKYGAYANSDLFKGMLAGIRKTVFPGGILRLDQVPEGVTVNTGGFLTVVSFDV